MTDKSKCQRCGAPLLPQRIQVPVYIDEKISTKNGSYKEKVFSHYKWETDYGDCARCHGSY